jgi:hypothetical protein
MTLDATEEKVAYLSQLGSYGYGAGSVEVRETRTSWVFVTERPVHKLKKPLKNRQFDFSSLKAREANTRDKDTLDRRLGPDVYEGVPTVKGTGLRDLAVGIPAGLLLSRGGWVRMAIAPDTARDGIRALVAAKA